MNGDVRYGITLSSEEFGPAALVEQAVRAEERGYDFATVSDHFHPWTSVQGQSPFVWTTLGGAFARTTTLPIGTGVTCPILRVHPAIVAQAAASTASLAGDRFFLGVGTGEALNEHITGQRWPHIEQRQQMLIEAISVIRALWTGEVVDHAGTYFTVENARLFTVPATPPPIIVAASGEATARIAAEHGDGIWSTSPSPDVVDAYRHHGGRGPAYGQLTVCWGASQAGALDTAMHWWPNAGMPGQISQDLPTWSHFEAVAELVTPDRLAARLAIGPEPDVYLDRIQEYLAAGFDHVHFHQVGPDQEGFGTFWDEHLRPALQGASSGSGNRA